MWLNRCSVSGVLCEGVAKRSVTKVFFSVISGEHQRRGIPHQSSHQVDPKLQDLDFECPHAPLTDSLPMAVMTRLKKTLP